MSHCRPRHRHQSDRQDRHGQRLPPGAPNYTAKFSESYRQDGSPCLPPRLPDYAVSWQALPRWEKRFWVKVSGMSWESFLEAKAYLEILDKTDNKVYDWDDSAGKQALDEAKQRCWAKIHGLPYKKVDLRSADLYMDHIYWSSPGN